MAEALGFVGAMLSPLIVGLVMVSIGVHGRRENRFLGFLSMVLGFFFLLMAAWLLSPQFSLLGAVYLLALGIFLKIRKDNAMALLSTILGAVIFIAALI